MTDLLYLDFQKSIVFCVSLMHFVATWNLGEMVEQLQRQGEDKSWPRTEKSEPNACISLASLQDTSYQQLPWKCYHSSPITIIFYFNYLRTVPSLHFNPQSMKL